MNKCFISFIVLAFAAGCIMAQGNGIRPQRTPEEEAQKQTERLVRELGIKDSTRMDTIYRMHLKYARRRQNGLTRAENFQRMQSIYNELEVLLTPDEFNRFMNHPVEQPRRPHGAPQRQAAPSKNP